MLWVRFRTGNHDWPGGPVLSLGADVRQMRCSKADLWAHVLPVSRASLVVFFFFFRPKDQGHGRKNRKGEPAEAAASLVSSDVS